MNITDLPRHFDNIASDLGLDRLSEFLRDDIAPLMTEAWNRRFDTQTNSDGTPWNSDLVDTGELRDSCEVAVEGDRVVAGPGGARNEDVAAAQAGHGNFVSGIDDTLSDEALELLDEWVGRAFKE